MDSGIRQVGWGLSSLAISFLVVLAFLACSGAEPPEAATQTEARKALPVAQFRVLSGNARVEDGALVFDGYQAFADAHHALAIWRGAFDAAQYSYLTYQLQSSSALVDVSLTWRRADTPTEVFRKHLVANPALPALADLSSEADWRGRIQELGLHVVPSHPDTRVAVSGLALEPWSQQRALVATLSQWLEFRGWTHRSLNYLRGHPGEEGVSPMPYAAAWSVLAALILLLVRMLGGTLTGTAYAVVFFVPWIAVDMLWQRELLAQLQLTREQFQGKTLEQKHLADEDSAIYRYAKRLKRDVLPDEPARIFIADDTTGHDYTRLKTHYYLLPHNVYNFGSGAPRPAIRRGDYILVLADNADPVYVADESRLIWTFGRQVRAQEVDVAPLGRLYLLTDRSLEWQRDE